MILTRCIWLAMVWVGVAQEPGAKPDEAPELTIESIHGALPGKIDAVPAFAWVEGGSLLLLDPRTAEAERTIERLDPATGERSAALDLERARESWKEVRGEAPGALPWPEAFDARGARGLYLFDGDLYVLELEAGRLRRLTETEAEEKSAQFSPDGTRLAFVRENDLYAIEVESGQETRLTRDGSETTLNGTLSWVYWEEIFGRQDIGYWWSDDSTAIAYLQTDESGVGVSHFLDFKPAEARLIRQRYPKAGMANPKVRVGVVELEADAGEPETTWVQIDPESYEYVARVQWLPDSKRLSVQTMNRAQDWLGLYWVERASGEASLVLEEKDAAWVNIHDDLRFLKSSDEFLWVSERDGYAHLYLYNLDGSLVRRLTEGPWALRSAGGGPFWLRQAVVGIDEAGGWVYFTALEKSSIEDHLYRVRFDGTGMERLTEEDGSHGITMRPDCAFYVDDFSTIRKPPALRIHEADGSLKRVLSESRVDLVEALGLSLPEQFTIEARDGFAMPAELVKPPGFDASKRYPLILYVYGGPSAPTVADAWRRSILQDNLLAREGYLVALVDNRAATAISHKLESLLLRRMSGEVERNDVLDAVAWFKEQPYVDPDRVGVWGWSGGGSFTLNLMTHSDAFRAGIAVAAVTDWHYYDTKWAEFAMKRPEDNPDGYKATSFVESAKDLKGRLLLVHGTYDDNVHPQNAWAFVNQLIEHNIAFDLMMYPMRQHGISDRPARIHLLNKMIAHWNEHLGAGPKPVESAATGSGVGASR